MMHYAHVVMEAKEMGFPSETSARNFARRVVTAAAILAIAPEDVLTEWREKSRYPASTYSPVMETMFNVQIPEEVC